MNKLTKIAICIALPVCGLVSGTSAFALTASDTVPVTATVIDSCTVNSTALTFGNYNGIVGSALDSVGTVTAVCTMGTAFSVALDAGTGSGAAMTARLLTGPGGATLAYSIFCDAPRTQVWGDGSGGTDVATGTGTGVAQSFTMYGRVPSLQTSTVGSYTDSVTVTLTY
jgi:spore coat protein U-like protein